MISREEVESVLARIRPFLQADQGDIELVAVVGNDARVRMTGACANCPSARMTLVGGVEAVLRERISGFEHVHAV